MEIKVDKQEVFTDYVWSFMMPDHEHWKKEIEDIILVEKNKALHNFSTENFQDRPVRAHKTAWDSFARYPAVFNIIEIIAATITKSIEQEGWEAPKLSPIDGWINWFDKNQWAQEHEHNCLLSAVYYVSSEHSPSNFFFHRNDRFRLRKKNEDANIKLVKPKEGSVIFFTGCQTHSVSPNTSDQTRITLAANFMGEYVKIGILMMGKSKLFIGTPCYGGMITADYFKSCMQLVALAASKKIELQFGTIGNESLITRARNTLVQLFMDGDYTHLLFIDSDLAFNPEAVIRMIDYDKDVVTGIYPRKTIDWIKVKKRLKENPDMSEDQLLAASLQYNLNVKDPENILLEKGFIEVMDGPSGFMLIKRDVFVRMAEVYPELKFVPDQHINQSHEKEFDYHKTSDWNYTFFDTMIEPQTKRYLSEDYAFCRLWQNMGGKIYADIMSGMTHYGNYAFRGNVGTQFLPQNNK